MALTDTAVLYEVLLRFDEDGKIVGAHQIEARIIKDGAQVLAHIPGVPTSLDPGKLNGALSEEIVGWANQITDLQTERDALRRSNDEKDARIAELIRVRPQASDARGLG